MDDKSVLEKLKDKGEEVFTQISGELVQNPVFMRAFQKALKAKKTYDKAATTAMSAINLPSSRDFEKLNRRLDAIEEKLEEVLAAVKTRRRGRTAAE